MRYFAFLLISLLACAGPTHAGPYIPAGDSALRHDLMVLADAGIISGPMTTWPLAWGPILNDLNDAGGQGHQSPAIVNALARVRARANWETRRKDWTFSATAGIADNPIQIRSFQSTPRGNSEIGAGASWIDDWFSLQINVQSVDSDQDADDVRMDHTYLGFVAGNWSIGASTQQRWWGPGNDGSLILSNNARPFPAITIDRIFTDAFDSKWLGWMGPWDFSVIFGQLEKRRAVSNARFFGMRFNFRPVRSLEVGLSRSAQWCGDDRPCDASTFKDLLLGNDNIGDAGIGPDNEPGNQMAGLDFRWTPSFMHGSVAAYGQFIGEDEAGGFPSRYLVQVGIEGAGYVRNRWSYRWFAELAGTSCDFVSDDLFNCGYRQSIYQSGYTFRGRIIGHGVDNDARLISAGLLLVDEDDSHWNATLRFGDVNRGGGVDAQHSISPTPREILSLDVSHKRAFSLGTVDVGIGYQQLEDPMNSTSSSDGRFYLQWRSSY